jgi:hypothetical protein
LLIPFCAARSKPPVTMRLSSTVIFQRHEVSFLWI